MRKGLQMGADDGVHVVDDACTAVTPSATSAVLAAAIDRLAPDLVLMGSESTDARMSVVPAMVAERTGRPQLTFAGKVDVDGDDGARPAGQTDDGYDVVEASLPALVSVVEKINEPRYPSFKGIMAAKKKPVETLVALRPRSRRQHTSGCPVRGARCRTSRPAHHAQAGTVVTDEGDGGVKLAEFLSAQKFI